VVGGGLRLARVMRRLGIVIAVVALSVAGVATVAHATATLGLRTPVTVTPARGTPTTAFTVRFTTPLATGTSQGLRSWETASVVDRGQTGPSCTSNLAVRLRPAVADHRVSVTLPTQAKPWCAGAYAGTITLSRLLGCNPGPALRSAPCPEIAFAPEPIGHFRFTVSHLAS
jgi:hypothetical protein